MAEIVLTCLSVRVHVTQSLSISTTELSWGDVSRKTTPERQFHQCGRWDDVHLKVWFTANRIHSE